MSNRDHTIVAVDDDTVMLAFLEHTLKPHYTFVSFTTTESAVDWLGHGIDVDLFLVDINMPIHDGIEFVHSIRAMQPYAETPVSLVSAIGPEQLESKARLLEVDHYLSKPFKPDALLDHVRGLLRPGEVA